MREFKQSSPFKTPEIKNVILILRYSNNPWIKPKDLIICLLTDKYHIASHYGETRALDSHSQVSQKGIASYVACVQLFLKSFIGTVFS